MYKDLLQHWVGLCNVHAMLKTLASEGSKRIPEKPVLVTKSMERKVVESAALSTAKGGINSNILVGTFVSARIRATRT